MKTVDRNPIYIERMRITAELLDEAMRIKAQSIRRQNPGLSEDVVAERVKEWLYSRPHAPNGDAPGRLAWHRFPEWAPDS